MSKLQKIQDYIHKNKVTARNGRQCVDGRYAPKTIDSGMIARPGADAGYLLILLALKNQAKIEPGIEEITEKLLVALENIEEDFYIHTDHHANPSAENYSIGCGHLTKAANPNLSSAYKVSSNDTQKLIVLLKQLIHELPHSRTVRYPTESSSMNHSSPQQVFDPEDSDRRADGVFWFKNKNSIKVTTLEGEHKEEGVLINTGTKFSIKPHDTNRMFFVYDKTRDDEFIHRLFELLNLPEINFEDFKQLSDTQLQATLTNLAKGLPMYEFNADLENSKVKYLDDVS